MAAGAVLVPYVSVWILSSNEQWRQKWLFNNTSVDVQRRIRRHFGHQDFDSLAYPDRSAEDFDYRLPGEASLVDRQIQAEVESREEVSVSVRLSKTENEAMITETETLPGNVLSHTLDADAITFTNDKTLDMDDDTSMETDTANASSFVGSAFAFSPWQYHRPVDNTSTASSSSHESLERSRLEFEIDALLKERKEGLRSMDDIESDLAAKRDELRKISRWRQWLRLA